jgi:hypothetical protein
VCFEAADNVTAKGQQGKLDATDVLVACVLADLSETSSNPQPALDFAALADMGRPCEKKGVDVGHEAVGTAEGIPL